MENEQNTKQQITKEFITYYLDEKIRQNPDYIVVTFYDLRIKRNLSEEDTDIFLKLAKIRLENLDYQVYFTGAEFTYKRTRIKVQDNQYLIATKNTEGIDIR